jgi:hypothetical protein
VLGNAEYMSRTRTGVAVLAFVNAYARRDGARGSSELNCSNASAQVLAALVTDLAERRPYVRFGSKEECAHETLVHLLDMIEPAVPKASSGPASTTELPATAVQSVDSPITRLFLHRYKCILHCKQCKKTVSSVTDVAVVFNLFHFDCLRAKPTTPKAFSEALCVHVSEVGDFKCPNCEVVTQAYRVYSLAMVPEIIICSFNLYSERLVHYFPEKLPIPASAGGDHVFRIVGQVEHAGNAWGGHYWARCLRTSGAVYVLNDTGVTATTPNAFRPSAETYMVFYHYDHLGAELASCD